MSDKLNEGAHAPHDASASQQVSAPGGISSRTTWTTKQLATLALLSALGLLLSFIEFPIFPAAPFLKYDPSMVAALVAGLAFGPASGVAVGVVVAGLHGLLMGNFPGALMNIIVMLGFVLVSSCMYKRYHTFKGGLVSLAVGGVVSIGCALLSNILITPWYMGYPLETILALIPTVFLPFNALKAVINCVLTALVYKSISNLIKPKKEQVKGR